MSDGPIFPDLGLEALPDDQRERCGELIIEVSRFIKRLIADLVAADRSGEAASAITALAEAEHDRFIAEYGRLGEIAWRDAWTVVGVLIDRRPRD